MTEAQTFPPYEQGHFDVSNGHCLYYERYGGLPVLFVHGGPGAGFSEDELMGWSGNAVTGYR